MQGIISVFYDKESAEDDASNGGDLYEFPEGMEILGHPFQGSKMTMLWVVLKGGRKLN